MTTYVLINRDLKAKNSSLRVSSGNLIETYESREINMNYVSKIEKVEVNETERPLPHYDNLPSRKRA